MGFALCSVITARFLSSGTLPGCAMCLTHMQLSQLKALLVPFINEETKAPSLRCYMELYEITSILLTAVAAKSLQSCLTLCDLIDGSPPGSPIPGILQARVLEWGAIAFSIFCLAYGNFIWFNLIPFPGTQN